MTIHEIVRDWLIAHDYDGLCNDCCGCGVNDRMPCGGECNVALCEPAYRTVATEADCEYMPCDPGDVIYTPDKARRVKETS